MNSQSDSIQPLQLYRQILQQEKTTVNASNAQQEFNLDWCDRLEMQLP